MAAFGKIGDGSEFRWSKEPRTGDRPGSGIAGIPSVAASSPSGPSQAFSVHSRLLNRRHAVPSQKLIPDSCALFPFEVVNWPCYGQDLTQGTVTDAFTPNDFSSSFGDGLSLFASGTSLYLLSSSSPFSVDETTAALTQLGTVTGLPAGFTDFTGAASPFVAVPEPAHLMMVAGGVLAGAVCLWQRRRTGQEQPRIPTHDSRAG